VEIRSFSVRGGRWDGENGDTGNGKKTKEKVNGQRKWEAERKHEGEHKGQDTKRKEEAKKITKAAKMRVLYWNVVGLRKKEEKFWDYVR
jgi:hypothetical protein